MNKITSILEWTFKLYALTLVIPLTITIGITIAWIIGIPLKYNFFETIWKVWSGFYVIGKLGEGTLLVLEAWRIQLGILFICFLINVDKEYNV